MSLHQSTQHALGKGTIHVCGRTCVRVAVVRPSRSIDDAGHRGATALDSAETERNKLSSRTTTSARLSCRRSAPTEKNSASKKKERAAHLKLKARGSSRGWPVDAFAHGPSSARARRLAMRADSRGEASSRRVQKYGRREAAAARRDKIHEERGTLLKYGPISSLARCPKQLIARRVIYTSSRTARRVYTVRMHTHILYFAFRVHETRNVLHKDCTRRVHAHHVG